MGSKFDQQRAKHQLLQVSINLMTILLCLSYVHRGHWDNVGKLWDSLLIPIIITGEILKLCLAKYIGRHDKDSITSNKIKRKNIPCVRDVLSGALLQMVCVILYGFTCIILGAPVLKNYEQTVTLSLLLTFLTVSPTIFLIGVNGTLQVLFCEKADFLTKSEETSLEMNKYNAVGTIFGAWAGSIVAPLDWDRDWQTYPIPNVIGALLGYGLANIYTCSRVLFTTGKLYINKKRW